MRFLQRAVWVVSLISSLVFLSHLLYFPLYSLDKEKLPNCRIFYRKDGGISVVYGLAEAKRRGETDDEFYKRIIPKLPELKDLEYDDFAVNQIPADRTKRNRWTGEKGKGVTFEVSTGTISTGTIKLSPKTK